MDDTDQQPHNESKLAVSPDFDAFVIRKSQFAVATLPLLTTTLLVFPLYFWDAFLDIF